MNMTDEKQKLGRYQLLALLATGGMAEIFLARQTGIRGFERLVVVKRILPHLKYEKKFLDMFFDEARIAAQLNHPNIVQIYELGQEGDDFFIAMEYLEGESLAYLVREANRGKRALSPALAAGIISQVCDGLDCAHTLADEQGNLLHVVHRDVSPQNIIILFSGGVKLVDFGVAKAASKIHQTRVGTLKGKLAYMSPEQCLANDVDHRADIFSAGVVLWELLTRRRLFKREQEAATINAIVNNPILPVRKLNPEISVVIETIVAKALQKDPQDRFTSAGEMSIALREYIRKSSAAAGVHDLSAFAHKVFAERARTKRRLLDDIRAGGTGHFALSVLKPETEESIPSGSGDSGSDVNAGSLEIDVSEPLSKEIEEHPTRQGPSLAEMKKKSSTGLPKPAQAIEEPSGEVPTRRVPSPFAKSEKLGIYNEKTEISADPDTVRSAKPLKKPPPLKPPAPETPPTQPQTGRLVAMGAGVLVVILVMIAWAALSRKSPLPGDDTPDHSDNLADAGNLLPQTAGVITTPDAGPNVADGQTSSSGATNKLGDRSVDAGHVKPAADEDKLSRHGDSSPRVIARPKKSRPGYLRLDTAPWSEVYLGKHKLGITPLLGAKLSAGTHRLTLKNPQLNITKSINVTIRPGKTTSVFRELQR